MLQIGCLSLVESLNLENLLNGLLDGVVQLVGFLIIAVRIVIFIVSLAVFVLVLPLMILLRVIVSVAYLARLLLILVVVLVLLIWECRRRGIQLLIILLLGRPSFLRRTVSFDVLALNYTLKDIDDIANAFLMHGKEMAALMQLFLDFETLLKVKLLLGPRLLDLLL